MEDVEGAASSRFLDVENATEADKEKFQSIMREIGKQVWKKPGKPGSEKRALFDAYMSRSLSPEDTEEVKERKRLNASKKAQYACMVLGILKQIGEIDAKDTLQEKMKKLRKISVGEMQRYMLAAKCGVTRETALRMTGKEILDALAEYTKGPGASHAQVTYDGLVKKAGIGTEAASKTLGEILDLATQRKRGAGMSHTCATRSGWLEAFGIDAQSAQVVAGVQATQVAAKRLALAKSLGVDLNTNATRDTMGLSKSEFDALSPDERRAVKVTTESLDIADAFDLTPDEAFELRDAMSLRNVDPDVVMSDIITMFGDVMDSLDKNRPATEMFLTGNKRPRLTGELLAQLAGVRHRCPAL